VRILEHKNNTVPAQKHFGRVAILRRKGYTGCILLSSVSQSAAERETLRLQQKENAEDKIHRESQN
jgi:hypothetical protein